MVFRLPNDDEHTAVIGRNGSGKTFMGAWLLSKRNLRTKPYVIVDYKGDELLNSIAKVKPIGYRDTPQEPGLYILHGHPSDVTPMEDWMLRVWETGNIGVYFDEGYMVPDQGGLTGLLTQGRSLRIPVIMLTQRPTYVNRFVFSEASHISSFHLNDRRDAKIIQEFTPPGFLETNLGDGSTNTYGRLPKWHSRWYNIKDDETHLLRPVPSGEKIRAEIEAQLTAEKRWL